MTTNYSRIRSFWVATHVNGRGIRYVESWPSRDEYLRYAREVLARYGAGSSLSAHATIGEICASLTDLGPGHGARSHCRVDRADARQYIRDGAESY